MTASIHAGGCHCGRIAFEVEGDIEKVMQCNCSHCRAKGYLLYFTSPDRFTLKTPAENAATYLFNKKVIQHHFCPTCGAAPYGEGKGPDGAPMIAVNVRCLPDVDLDALAVQHVDGKSF